MCIGTVVQKEKEAKLAFQRSLHYNPWLGTVATKLVQLDKKKMSDKQTHRNSGITEDDSRIQNVSRSKSGGSLTVV